jgi:hypothetical protein
MMSRPNSLSKDTGRPCAPATGDSHIPDLQYTPRCWQLRKTQILRREEVDLRHSPIPRRADVKNRKSLWTEKSH